MKDNTPKKNLYDQVLQGLQKQIMAGEYKKGDLLPSENELAKQAKVSRVTVREALRLLSEMGLIETRKGIGSFVVVDANQNEVTGKIKLFLEEFESNFDQVIRIKLLIDPEIAKHLAQFATEKEIAELGAILNRMAQNKHKNRIYAEASSAFHLAMVRHINIPLLNHFYENLEKMEDSNTQIMVLPAKEQRQIKENDVAQHAKILKAIQDHNPDLAYLYTKEHLAYFQTYYKQCLTIFSMAQPQE